MDVSDASYYIHENNKNKGSRMGQTKKTKKKTTLFSKMSFSRLAKFSSVLVTFHRACKEELELNFTIVKK